MIELMLENANWAPTHGLTEPWRFRIFQGESRQKLSDTLQRLYQEHTPRESFRPDKFEKLGKNPLLAPVVITIGMHRDLTGKIPELEEIAAVACAVQNMHLTAAALGLGAFWSSPPIIYTDAMRDFLELDKQGQCLGLFYVGWPQEGLSLESRRTPIDQKSSWQ
jgi:nitroreductase